MLKAKKCDLFFVFHLFFNQSLFKYLKYYTHAEYLRYITLPNVYYLKNVEYKRLFRAT